MKEPCKAATSEAHAKSVCDDFTYLCVYVHVSVSVHASVYVGVGVCALRREDNLGCCSSGATYLDGVSLLSGARQVAYHD